MARACTAPKKADEHAADPKEAAAAVDAKAEATKAVKDAREKGSAASRTDEKTVKRAIKLYDDGMGLPSIAKKLTEEGHRSAQGKELRPQTIRQWLLKEKGVAKLGTRPKAK